MAAAISPSAPPILSPFPTTTTASTSTRVSNPTHLDFRCHSSSKPQTLTISSSPTPCHHSVTAFAPATVANLGPGFDFLGCAVADASLALGDVVTATICPTTPPGHVTISSISTTNPTARISKLSKSPLYNCAGIAALAAMRMLGIQSTGVSISLIKGLPLGSGLGSSAASAAAAAVAINELFGCKLSRDELVLAGLESESFVSGYHADNIAPAILGGFVLIRSYEPFELMKLDFPATTDLNFVLVSPEFEAPTKKMREALPEKIFMKEHVRNSSQAAALVAALAKGDVEAIGSALSADGIVEPRRAKLIPGMEAVKKAALEAGAFGCTISGAGPTAVAVIEGEEKGVEIGERMMDAFMKEGNLKARATVAKLDRVGARVIGTSEHKKHKKEGIILFPLPPGESEFIFDYLAVLMKCRMIFEIVLN